MRRVERPSGPLPGEPPEYAPQGVPASTWQELAPLDPQSVVDQAKKSVEPTRREFYELGDRIAAALEGIAKKLGER